MTMPQLTRSLLIAALACGTALAQDDKKAAKPGLPEPKHKEHDALQAFVGTWDVTMRSEPMPGVPGMEKAMESTGTEHCELLNNGLWLKSTTNATMDGKPFQCLWLVGYDPFAKGYVGVFASSDESQQGLCTMTGSYDDAKKTWLWSGQTPHGEMRSGALQRHPGDDHQLDADGGDRHRADARQLSVHGAGAALHRRTVGERSQFYDPGPARLPARHRRLPKHEWRQPEQRAARHHCCGVWREPGHHRNDDVQRDRGHAEYLDIHGDHGGGAHGAQLSEHGAGPGHHRRPDRGWP
jgi:hypothetical protein